MNFTQCRYCAIIAFTAVLLLFGQRAMAQTETPAIPNGTVPAPNRVQNGVFECAGAGYYDAQNSRGQSILLPNGWTLAPSATTPFVSSARIYFEKRADPQNGSCYTEKAHVERIEGKDSVLVQALDLETPPQPGKPFDVTLYQKITSTVGAAYSISGWMLSLCGGSAVPSNCPKDYYIAKQLGIDPYGGADPDSNNVVWVENRNNFVDSNNKRIGWANLYTAAIARSSRITIFARMRSPFQWHGNHGFIDAVDVVYAPTSWLVVTPPPAGSRVVTLAWNGSIGPDIPTIEGGKFRLYYDVQYWHEKNGAWRDLQVGADGGGSMNFVARCAGSPYQFRVRARAEQPEGQGGAWPNQRFPGVWHDPYVINVPAPVQPPPPINAPHKQYFPQLGYAPGC